MAIRDLKGKINDKIPVENVLVSVFDKSGLEKLVPELISVNPNIRFMSTGGTYTRLKEILSNNHTEYSHESNLIEVAEYTNFPEMEGGLVKTLHPKIHAGLLGERNNPEHQKYLKETLNGGVFIDMAIINLYPFSQVVSKKGTTFEKARGNIDIGGPTMIRAAAKNFPSCAVVCKPTDYGNIIQLIRDNEGSTTFDLRLQLAREAFKITENYDKAINKYLSKPESSPENVRKEYKFVK